MVYYFICQLNVVYLADKLHFSAVLFSFICRRHFEPALDGNSPRDELQESARHPTRVRAPNDSSPFAVGTRVRQS